MEQHEIVVSFESSSRALANQSASDLQHLLERRVGETVSARIEKTDATSQDLGSTLVLIFGSGAAVAIAEGIKAYLAKAGSSVTIRTRNGEVLVRGDAAKAMDVTAVVSALTKRPK